MKNATRNKIKGAIVGLFVLIFGLHNMTFPLWEKNYKPPTNDLKQLTGEQLLFALAGFREMIAGILWVRADSYFDEGNYDAILPIIRMVTYLDPKQIDVYSTGMWHIAYNFTDQESRADRRNVPIAVAFGEEGAQNNSYTYELYFETGWLWYHRIQDDFPNAVKWFQQANSKADVQPARQNILASAHLRNGRPDEALNTYYELYGKANKVLNENPTDRGTFNNKETIELNLDSLIVRMVQRGWFAAKGGYFDQGNYDTKPPFDVKFATSVSVVEPRVLQIDGMWNVYPVGTRIRVVLRDQDYPGGREAGLDWAGGDASTMDAPKDRTYMQDELFVRNLRFSKRIDMSRDPTIYPMIGEKYYLDFYYNPRQAPAHMQDKFGFNGEGMTDTNFLNSEVREGQRVIFYRVELTRDMLERRGEWNMGDGKVPTFSTPNFVSPKSNTLTNDFVSVPGLRTN